MVVRNKVTKMEDERKKRRRPKRVIIESSSKMLSIKLSYILKKTNICFSKTHLKSASIL